MTLAQTRTSRPVAQRLELFSSAAIKQIATALGTAASAPRSTQLRQLTELIGTQRHRELLERELSADEWAMLTLLPLELAPFRLRVFMIALWERGLNDLAALGCIHRLLSFGCLLPVQTAWNHSKLGIETNEVQEWGIQAAFELAPSVASWAQKYFASEEWLTPVEPPEPASASALPNLQRAAFVLLGELARKPLRVTSAGLPNKTDLRRLVAALTSGGPAAKREGAPGSVPPLVYFTLAVLAGAELLRLEGGGLRPDAQTREFFAAPEAQQVQQLFIGWCRSRFDDFGAIPTLSSAYIFEDAELWMIENAYRQPNAQQLLTARVAVAEALSRLLKGRPDAWFRIDSFATYVYQKFPEILFPRVEDYAIFYFQPGLYPGARNPHRKYTTVYRAPSSGSFDAGAGIEDRTLYQDTDWLEVEGAFVRQVLGASMRLLGLVEVGPSGPAPDRFRLTAMGRAVLLGEAAPAPQAPATGRTAIVQPNFEVLVLDAARSFGLLGQLDAFAERRTLDRAATYQLTRTALVRGFDAGWTGPRVIETLEAANGAPLPQNVRYTLDEWIQLYERLSLREAATLLETDGPEELERLLADPKLGRLLGMRLGPSLVLVRSAAAVAVAARIAEITGEIHGVDYSQSPQGLMRIREPDRIELDAAAAEPYLRYRLETFATLQATAGDRLRYQIDSDSVSRGVAGGASAKQMIDLLSEATGAALPPEFRLRLLAWSGAVPALKTEALVAIALPPEAGEWEELRLIPALGRYVRAVPGPRVALVAASEIDGIREELLVRGLSLSEAELPENAFQVEPAKSDLKSSLLEFADNPNAIRRALKSLGILAEVESPRRGWYR